MGKPVEFFSSFSLIKQSGINNTERRKCSMYKKHELENVGWSFETDFPSTKTMRPKIFLSSQ